MPTEKHRTSKPSTEHKSASTSKPSHKMDNEKQKTGEHAKPSQAAANDAGSGKAQAPKTHK